MKSVLPSLLHPNRYEPNSFLELIWFHVRLLFVTPKNYLYTYRVPASAKVKLYSFTPKLTQIAAEYKKKIESLSARFAVEFVGSASYGIIGEKEIDLYVTTKNQISKDDIDCMSHLLGKPSHEKKGFVQWFLRKTACNLDIVLTDPTHPHYKSEMRVIRLLQSSPALLDQYRRIKESMQGKSCRLYHQKKIAFFHDLEGLVSL